MYLTLTSDGNWELKCWLVAIHKVWTPCLLGSVVIMYLSLTSDLRFISFFRLGFWTTLSHSLCLGRLWQMSTWAPNHGYGDIWSIWAMCEHNQFLVRLCADRYTFSTRAGWLKHNRILQCSIIDSYGKWDTASPNLGSALVSPESSCLFSFHCK